MAVLYPSVEPQDGRYGEWVDALRRRPERHENRARGDLRPGARRDPVRGPGGRDSPRQRVGVRLVGLRVDDRSAARLRGRDQGPPGTYNVNGFIVDFGAPFGG